MLVVLPFIGDQVVCLNHTQAGGEAVRKESLGVVANGGASAGS